jgi:ectoine hydroxylase-related dioxygenase (phytanoyl-CoA dioxygenase family)
VVWPGSHLTLCELVRARGQACLAFDAPRPSLAPHTHVHLSLGAGDVIVVHPMLAHSWSVNRSPHVRHMVYYRLTKSDHERERARMFTEPFCLYEGL